MEPIETPAKVLLINKPLRWTSFDVIRKLQYKFRTKKIGHAGTLDPLATGLLIICTGKMTKSIETFMGLEKEYTGTFVIGQTTPSFDLETEVSAPVDITHITEEQIQNATLPFKGIIRQLPPMHSAIQINGQRAYDLARSGKTVELKQREIEIKEFEITRIALPAVDFRVVCSKGTYIRSLARDFGEVLGVGAHVTALCRTRIGEFTLSNALTIEQIDS
jgi:tRNA pseudouridine55 synthase